MKKLLIISVLLFSGCTCEKFEKCYYCTLPIYKEEAVYKNLLISFSSNKKGYFHESCYIEYLNKFDYEECDCKNHIRPKRGSDYEMAVDTSVSMGNELILPIEIDFQQMKSK